MELHALEAEFPVAQAHDDAIGGFGGNLQVAWKRFALDDERVVARRCEWLCEVFKNTTAVVLDFAGLAVHQFLRADDASTESRSDGLMAKAHTEDRNVAGEAPDQRNADAGFLRSTRAGRNDDAFGAPGPDFVEGDLIVAANFELLTHLPKILGEVVGKRIVVVEEQNHVALIF